MISLTERQVYILSELHRANNYVTIKRLSDLFHISERSIRYDLDFINSFLNEFGITLIRKHGQGIMVQMHPKQESEINEALQQTNHLVLSRDNLAYTLAVQIIFDQETTLDRLGELFQTSKSRIFHYLPAVENLLKRHGITLEKKRSKGISVQGNEIDIRYSFISLINAFTESSHVNKKNFINLFSQGQLNQTKKVIQSFEHETQVQFSDGALDDLLLTIGYQSSRIVKKLYVRYPFVEIKKDIESLEFQLIKKELEKITNRAIPDDEVTFTLKQFKLSKISTAPLGRKNLVANEKAYRISLFFAKEASKSIGIDFTNDDELIHGLTYHLQVSLNRIQNRLPIKNTLTEQIKYKFRFIYEITRKIVVKVEQKLMILFPEEEIAFIAMHLGASYERHSVTGFMPSALIVCGSGLATSSLLASRLKVMMPELKITGPINLSNLKSCNLEKIDIIISTVPIDFSRRKVIVVNPLLEAGDLIKLRKLLFHKAYQKQMSDLLKINQPVSTLEALIPENRIQLNESMTHWRDAIARASKPLIDNTNISSRYVDAMIKAVEELGPYMVFIPEVAMVHASYKDGVSKDGMSLLTLKEPITFGDRTNVTVKVVIVMCSTKADSDHFIKLVKILDNHKNMDILKHAINKEDILYLNNSDR